MEYNWKGKNFKQWCIDNDLDYHAVYHQFYKGTLGFEDFMKKLEREIKSSLKIGNIVRLKLNGKNIKDYCREKNLNYSTVMRRVYLYKGDIDRAIKETEEIRDKAAALKEMNLNNPCLSCQKRNCLGCPNYLYEEADKKWKEEKNEILL